MRRILGHSVRLFLGLLLAGLGYGLYENLGPEGRPRSRSLLVSSQHGEIFFHCSLCALQRPSAFNLKRRGTLGAVE